MLHPVDSVLEEIREGGSSLHSTLCFSLCLFDMLLFSIWDAKNFHPLYSFSVCDINNMRLIDLVNICGGFIRDQALSLVVI